MRARGYGKGRRKLRVAIRQRLRRVAMTLESVGRDGPAPESRDDVERCEHLFGGLASWGLGA